MFGRKKQQPEIRMDPREEINFSLLENFSTLCVNKCLKADAL